MSKFFYHGIIKNPYEKNYDEAIVKMINIILSGGLKSRNLLGNPRTGGFNGNDYISLCNKMDSEKYIKCSKSSFRHFIHNNFCFVISNKIPAIKTKYISDEIYDNLDEYKKFIISNSGSRFSDLFDEYQVRDEVSIHDMIAIGLPFKKLEQYYQSRDLLNINYLINLAYVLDLDIVDTTDELFIENYEKSKEIYTKKIKTIEFR